MIPRPSRRSVATLLILAAILGSYVYGHHRGVQALARETHTALCALKHDVERKAATTERFVADVRAGRRDPIPGISNADLQRSIDNYAATLRALKPLACSR